MTILETARMVASCVAVIALAGRSPTVGTYRALPGTAIEPVLTALESPHLALVLVSSKPLSNRSRVKAHACADSE